jgi:hypothetical protein
MDEVHYKKDTTWLSYKLRPANIEHLKHAPELMMDTGLARQSRVAFLV